MEGDVERAFQLAIAALEQFSDSKYKADLVEMCDKVLNRMK